jgi:hypothetical protein
VKVYCQKNGSFSIGLTPEDPIDEAFVKVFAERGGCTVKLVDPPQSARDLPAGSVVFSVEGVRP